MASAFDSPLLAAGTTSAATVTPSAPPGPGGLEGVISSAYNKFLGRPGDASEWATWLPTFQQDPVRGLAGIAGSEEARNRGLMSLLNPQAGPSAASGLADDTRGVEEALYNKAASDINRSFDDQAQARAESLFGRGVGRGTILPEALGRNEEARGKALGTARQQAVIGAGAEARANQEALRRLFETESGAGFRQQALDLQGRQIAQQGGIAGAQLNAQGDLLKNQQDAQLLNLLLSGGIGLGGILTSPQVLSGLQKLFSSDGVGSTGGLGGAAGAFDTTGLSLTGSSPFINYDTGGYTLGAGGLDYGYGGLDYNNYLLNGGAY